MAEIKSTWVFGKVAVALGLITEEQAREAAAMQEEMEGEGASLRFGEVLVEGRILPREAIAKVLRAAGEPDPDEALFGAVAVENGFVTPEGLKECLDIQQDLGADIEDASQVPKTGEICLTEEKMEAAAVEAVLKVQARLRIGAFSLTPSKMLLVRKKRAQPLKVRTPEEALFFKLAVRRNLLTPAQVEEILREQASDVQARPAPEVAYELGYLDQVAAAGLQAAVGRKEGVQERRRKHQTTAGIKLFSEDVEFSSIAMQNGFVTKEQVRKAEQIYKTVQFLGYPRNLGEILFDLGVLTSEKIKAVLDIQRLKGGVLPAYRLDEIVLTAEEDEALLAHAREGGQITQAQVTECLRIRKELGKAGIPRKLGEVLLVKGFLFREDAKRKPVVRERKRRPAGPAAPAAGGVPPWVWAAAGVGALALVVVVALAIGSGNRKEPGPKGPEKTRPPVTQPDPKPAPPEGDEGPPPGKDPEECEYFEWKGKWVRKEKVREAERRDFHEALRKAVAEEGGR
jgi:hypothetical protein